MKTITVLLNVLLAFLFLSSLAGKILRLKECHKFDADFSITSKNTRLSTGLLLLISTTTVEECVLKCISTDDCDSINHHELSRTCELLKDVSDVAQKLYNEDNEGWIHYQTNKNAKEVGEICRIISPCPSHYCEDACQAPGFNCTCSKGYFGESCEEVIGGPTFPAKSCKQLKEVIPSLKSGFYFIELLEKVNKVYCDMDVDGGGWTMIANLTVAPTDDPTKLSYDQIQTDDVYSLADVASGKYLLSAKAARTLDNLLEFQQLRLYCHKPNPGRTIHVITTLNSTGSTVVNHVLGKSDDAPFACGSYVTLPDDSSVLFQDCSKIGSSGAWSGYASTDLRDNDERLYSHIAFISYGEHFNIYEGGRLECDDFVQGNPQISGVWQYYVR